MSGEHPRKIFLLKPEYPSYGICGSRGAGKSVLLEFTMDWYRKHGYVCLDWFGSIDHENAYWCIPDTVPIGRFHKLESEDSSKLIEYLKTRFNLGKDETGFQVQRIDERTVVCTSENFTFKIRLSQTLHHGVLTINPDSMLPRKSRLIAYRNADGELIVYGRNPARNMENNVKVRGHPVLIILPKTTVIKQRNPLCVCGIPIAEHADEDIPDNNPQSYRCNKRNELIKTVTDDTPLKDIIELAVREKRVCIFNRGFYSDQRDAYRTLAKMLKELPFLILRGSIPKETSFCIGFREAGQIAPSGLKGMKGDYETNVKRELQTYIREARHLRTVLVLDFQRQGDIAKSIASQRDFLLVKRSTKDLMPDDYLWLFDAIDAKKERAYDTLDFDQYDKWPAISQLKPYESYVLFPDRHFEHRIHGMPSFRHKKPNDSWAIDANCEITYLDKKEVEKGPTAEKIKKLQAKQSEKERIEFILKDVQRLREDEGLSWNELAKRFGFLDKKTGAPSGDQLKMRVRRWLEKQQDLGK